MNLSVFFKEKHKDQAEFTQLVRNVEVFDFNCDTDKGDIPYIKIDVATQGGNNSSFSFFGTEDECRQTNAALIDVMSQLMTRQFGNEKLMLSIVKTDKMVHIELVKDNVYPSISYEHLVTKKIELVNE